MLRQFWNASLLFLSLVLCSRADAAAWDRFHGHLGAYGVRTPNEISDMAREGFDLALLSYAKPGSPMAEAIKSHGVKYIDTFPWAAIRSACSSDQTPSKLCFEDKSPQILDQIQKHVDAVSGDESIIGFWVLDDYPHADIRELLKRIHVVISEANPQASFPRATICGFGGLAPARRTPLHPFKLVTRGFDQAVSNFDPEACDLVALYPYGVDEANDPSDVDWSLSGMLSHMLEALRARGWDPKRQPLIGIPQAFGAPHPSAKGLYYTAPTGRDLTTQVVAYCKSGATAILAYTWHDSNKDVVPELYNTPDFVEGIKRGARECRNHFW